MLEKQYDPFETDNFETIRNNVLSATGSCSKTQKCSLKQPQNCDITQTESQMVLAVGKFNAAHKSENRGRCMESGAKKFDWSIKQRLSDLLQKNAAVPIRR